MFTVAFSILTSTECWILSESRLFLILLAQPPQWMPFIFKVTDLLKKYKEPELSKDVFDAEKNVRKSVKSNKEIGLEDEVDSEIEEVSIAWFFNVFIKLLN